MGEHAEMRLDGTLCEGCGEFLGDPVGFPRYCADCRREEGVASPFDHYASVPARIKVICPDCNHRVRACGYWQHRRDKHGDFV